MTKVAEVVKLEILRLSCRAVGEFLNGLERLCYHGEQAALAELASQSLSEGELAKCLGKELCPPPPPPCDPPPVPCAK